MTGMQSLILSLLALALLAGCGSKPAADVTGARLQTPAGPHSAEPNLAAGPDGTIVLSWLEDEQHGAALRFSVLTEAGWQPAVTIARGNDWFVNWADFPSVVPAYPDLWAAHWLVKSSGGTYSYDVAIALSRDRGQSWSASIAPHTDATLTEHGFVSLFPWQQGVGAVWLDGRNMSGKVAHSSHGGDGGMTLRSAVIGADGSLSNGQLIDELVCDCCQTDVTLGVDGPIAVYRNRTTGEIRDIYVAHAVDGRWRPGKTVNHDGWKLAGCPVNGPAIAAHEAEVAVAWFTAASDNARVRLARSTDGGHSFGPPIDVHTRRPLGRVDVELLDGGDAVVSWLQRSGPKRAELCLRRVAASGEAGPVHVVARTTAGRPSGVPQMVRDGDHLVLAWTAVTGKASQVLAARVSAEDLLTPMRR